MTNKKKERNTFCMAIWRTFDLYVPDIMIKTFQIGMAGLDTSHVEAFANLLHDSSDEHHVAGARITVAYPGGSPDFDLSINRVKKFTDELRDRHGVEIVDSLAAMRGKCDAVMLESVDGRVHLEQFREVAGWGVPVFIDKPLAVSVSEAEEIIKIAAEKEVRVTSASALRFAEAIVQALAEGGSEPVLGADLYGTMAFVSGCPGYFWYGIHSVEMLYTLMGPGCREVLTTSTEEHDVLVGRWADGRLGAVRGNRAGMNSFGGTIHRKTGSRAFEVSTGNNLYAGLLEKIIPFFAGETEVVSAQEMVEVIAFLDAANRSRKSQKWETL